MRELSKYLVDDVFQVSFEPNGDKSSPYAACFLVFILNELGIDPRSILDIDDLLAKLEGIKDSDGIYIWGEANSLKEKIQLTTFVITLKDILGVSVGKFDVLKIFREYGRTTHEILDAFGVKTGVRGSGNLAMFFAILAQFDMNSESLIDEWFKFHNGIESTWWSNTFDKYNHWQNGYHQLVVYDYFQVPVPRIEDKCKSVIRCLNRDGSFSKIPGGDGCYDYDAAFILSMCGNTRTRDYLKIAGHLSNSRDENGFCQNRYVRDYGPFMGFLVSLTQMKEFDIRRMLSAGKFLIINRGAQKIVWSHNPRRLDSPNLWEHWFKLLNIKKVYSRLGYPSGLCRYKKLTFLGIGYER